jgi:anti-sigma factor RsiW
MLTDKRLKKYLEGLLNEDEAKELEKLIEKNPELQIKLEKMRLDEEPTVGSLRRRHHLDQNLKRGSKVRYTTILPALLLLSLIHI